MKEFEDFERMKEAAEKELPTDGTELYIEQCGEYRADYDVVDSFNQPVYEIRGKVFQDAAGASVGTINKKTLALAPTYEISLTNGQTASLKMKKGPFKKEITGTINEKELLIKGLDKNAFDVDVLVDGRKIGSIRSLPMVFQNDTYVTLCVDDLWKEMMIALTAIVDSCWHKEED